MIAYNFSSKQYTPNIFIRIGLFLLTVLATAAGFGLTMLMALGSGYAIFLIIWGIITYGALELFIHSRGMFRAGVDDALLWMAGCLIFGGIELLSNNISAVGASTIILVLAAWGVLRYADRLMALVAYGAFISLIFYGLKTHIIIIPISVVAYFLFTRLSAPNYRPCLALLRMSALLSFYLAGNYFVIQNISASPLTWGWVWWTYTGIIPIAYIVWGIRKKDTILLWTGLGLVAAAVFTVRYYYHLMPAEIAMILAGSILIVTSYGLIRYLRTPKNGFTSAPPEDPHPLQNLPVESLILAETFKPGSTPVDQSGQFGGGSGGGAGAGGTY